MIELPAPLPRPLAFVLRHLLIGVPLALFIALFFSLGFDNPFRINFVYSLCIGLTCQLAIDLCRRGAARALGRGQWPGWPVTLLIVAAAVPLGIYGGYALAGGLLGHAVTQPSALNRRRDVPPVASRRRRRAPPPVRVVG